VQTAFTVAAFIVTAGKVMFTSCVFWDWRFC
jgi:hypothetical protein